MCIDIADIVSVVVIIELQRNIFFYSQPSIWCSNNVPVSKHQSQEDALYKLPDEYKVNDYSQFKIMTVALN